MVRISINSEYHRRDTFAIHIEKTEDSKESSDIFYFLRSFWQYWVHSLSVQLAQVSAALVFSQKRSG